MSCFIFHYLEQDNNHRLSLYVSFSVSQKREVNTVLADIIKHMTPDRAFEDAYRQVSSSLANRTIDLDYFKTQLFSLLFLPSPL